MILGLIYLTLYVIPVPPVGNPVEEVTWPDSRFIEIRGVLLHYVDYGSGDVLFVLLHGFGASVFSWRELVTNLSHTGRVVAFDRPVLN
mgnify:CR=1 FL=1